MVRFLENFDLREWHTFRTEAHARYFFEFSEPFELQNFLKERPFYFEKMLILGEGSNLLFTHDFSGLVIHPAVKGIGLAGEDDRQVWIKAGAGVVWDDFVQYAVKLGYGGVENLSLIPGKVGATPVQNIGAYGQEAGQVIDSVTGIDMTDGEMRVIPAKDCHFSYRNSIFKKELKDRFVVTSVVYKLNKEPELLLSYGDIAQRVKEFGVLSPTTVRDAIVSVRRSKLPDPAQIGNAGSFFKNPVVSNKMAQNLLEEFPGIPVYRESDAFSKLSAGWLIDRCGWKGYRQGDAGVHASHALVLVNYGNATGKEIYTISEEIKQSVLKVFGVELEREVNVI